MVEGILKLAQLELGILDLVDGLELAGLLGGALGLELALGFGGVHAAEQLLGLDAVAHLRVQGLDGAGQRGGQ